MSQDVTICLFSGSFTSLNNFLNPLAAEWLFNYAKTKSTEKKERKEEEEEEEEEESAHG